MSNSNTNPTPVPSIQEATHKMQLERAEKSATERHNRDDVEATQMRFLGELDYFDQRPMEKFYRDMVASRVSAYKDTEDLFNKLPKSHYEVADTFATPLRSTVKIIKNRSGMSIWRWNGKYFETGDDEMIYATMLDAIAAAHKDAVSEWLNRIEEWLTQQKKEYDSQLEATRKEILAEELEEDPAWTEAELEKHRELFEKRKKAECAAAAGPIWQETLGSKGVKKLTTAIAKHNVGASNAEYASFRNGVDKYLPSRLKTPGDTFDSNRYLVFNNGVLDVQETFKTKTFVFSEGHSPELPVTERHIVNCDFIDYSASYDPSDLRSIGAPATEGYMCSTGYREDMETLFTALGFGLFSGEILRCLPYMYGASGGGKGLLLRTLKHILPGPVRFAGRPVFSVGTTEVNRFAAASVINHPIIINDEMGKIKIDQEKLKEWSGGGTIKVEHKGRDPFEVEYRGVILTVLNTETPFNPAIDLEDQGGRTRYLPIYYPHSHSRSSDSEYKAPAFVDTEDRMKGGEASALVFHLLMRCMAHMETGEDTITRTSHQNELLAANRAGSDPVQGTLFYGAERGSWQSIPDDVEPRKQDLLPFSTYWDTYERFVRSAYGIEPKRKQQLLSEMRDAGLIIEYNRTNRVSGYVKAGTYSRALADVDPADIAQELNL